MHYTLISCFSLTVLAGCRGGGGGLADTDTVVDDGGSGSGGGATDAGATDGGSGDSGGPMIDPNFEPSLLDCPSPGSLPFETQSTAFAAGGQSVNDANPRNKDTASDILGNSGGALAFTTMDNNVAPSPDLSNFTGVKARTTNGEGLISTPIDSEFVSLWSYDGVEWEEQGRTQTSAAGEYSFSGVDLSPNRFQPYYAILEGDGTCAPHYMFLLDPGTQVVVTDIDGTMTLTDEELTQQINDGSYDPQENNSASDMMSLWADKGYTIVYLTARPHLFRSETRSWLRDHGFPVGPVISANTLVFGDSARQYKRTWVNRLTGDFGWSVVAAYGNATSDIEAYEDAGIAKDITFIIGENAGVADTVAIENNDYTNHIADFVTPYPDADG